MAFRAALAERVERLRDHRVRAWSQEYLNFADDDEFELYDSYDEVPPDFDTEEDIPLALRDNDDSVLKDTDGGRLLPQEDVREEPPADVVREMRKLRKARVVPFVRNLRFREGNVMDGNDVRAIQRALKSVGLYPVRINGKYDRRTAEAVRRFQRRKGIAADAVYGPITHRRLSHAFDARGIELLNIAKKKQQSKPASGQALLNRVQEKMLAEAFFLYSVRGMIGYTQGFRRSDGVRYGILPPRYPSYMDCSSGFKYIAYVAKRLVNPRMPDPDGLGWQPYGYTGTLAANGKSIGLGIRRCATVLYGWGTFQHVTMIVSTIHGTCWSHGSWAGPLILPWRYRTPNHVRVYPGIHY